MKVFQRIKNKFCNTSTYKFPNDVITDFYPLIIDEFNKQLEIDKVYVIKDMPDYKIKIKRTSDDRQLFWIHLLDKTTTPNIWNYTSYILYQYKKQTLYNAYHKGQYPGFFTK